MTEITHQVEVKYLKSVSLFSSFPQYTEMSFHTNTAPD
jgi:hypothetical protein